MVLINQTNNNVFGDLISDRQQILLNTDTNISKQILFEESTEVIIPAQYGEDFENNIWIIPGKDEEHKEQCGKIRQVFVDKNTGKKIIKRSWCYKKGCPICYEAWASRAASKIYERISGIMEMQLSQILSHWTISPPKSEHKKFFYDSDYKVKVEKGIFKILNHIIGGRSFGGLIFFHPFRWDEEEKKWYKSPHYHIIMNLNFIKYKKRISLDFEDDFLNNINNWIWKKIRNFKCNLENVTKAIKYELSHVGIDKEHPLRNSYKYFGAWSYNKFLKAKKLKIEVEIEDYQEHEFSSIDFKEDKYPIATIIKENIQIHESMERSLIIKINKNLIIPKNFNNDYIPKLLEKRLSNFGLTLKEVLTLEESELKEKTKEYFNENPDIQYQNIKDYLSEIERDKLNKIKAILTHKNEEKYIHEHEIISIEEQKIIEELIDDDNCAKWLLY